MCSAAKSALMTARGTGDLRSEPLFDCMNDRNLESVQTLADPSTDGANA
jgi:hypothetical protein